MPIGRRFLSFAFAASLSNLGLAEASAQEAVDWKPCSDKRMVQGTVYNGEPKGMGRIAVAKNFDGTLDVYAIVIRGDASLGGVVHSRQIQPNGDFGPWQMIGSGMAAGPRPLTNLKEPGYLDIGRNADGRLELLSTRFGVGSHLWQEKRGGNYVPLSTLVSQWEIWDRLGDAQGLGHIVVANNLDDRLEVFATDAKEGSAWHIWQDSPNGKFGTWRIMGDARHLGEIAVARNDDGRLELFSTDAKTGSAWHTWQDKPNGNFGSWQMMGDARGLGACSVILDANRCLALIATDAKSGSVWQVRQTSKNGNFGAWRIVGDARSLGRITVGSDQKHALMIFATDAKTGSTWHCAETAPGSGDFGKWLMMGKAIHMTDVAIANDDDGRLHYFCSDRVTDKDGGNVWQAKP